MHKSRIKLIPWIALYRDSSRTEVNSIIEWSRVNQKSLYRKKTWEMIVHGNICEPGPLAKSVPSIDRETWLKILGIILGIFIYLHQLISKASIAECTSCVCLNITVFQKNSQMFNHAHNYLWNGTVECAYYDKYHFSIGRINMSIHVNVYVNEIYL